MAGSTLDPDNAGQPRRRRKTLKDNDTRALGPSDSSDSGSDVVGSLPPDEPQPDVAPDEERRRIAENAYYRAEKRGFTPGQEERDWLEAEAELKARRKKRR